MAVMAHRNGRRSRGPPEVARPHGALQRSLGRNHSRVSVAREARAKSDDPAAVASKRIHPCSRLAEEFRDLTAAFITLGARDLRHYRVGLARISRKLVTLEGPGAVRVRRQDRRSRRA
jgi:hypothetical protein